jgi:hypothetical protein
LGNIFPRIKKARNNPKNERKMRKYNKYVNVFTDSNRTDDNYGYSIEKLL